MGWWAAVALDYSRAMLQGTAWLGSAPVQQRSARSSAHAHNNAHQPSLSPLSPRHVCCPAECAHWFDKPAFMRPLVEGGDPLPGLHANTHMAQVRVALGGLASSTLTVAQENQLQQLADLCLLVLVTFQLCKQTCTRTDCIPLLQVQGFAARYEQVGDPEALAATAQFFGLLLQVR